jgi:hypothetical protein
MFSLRTSGKSPLYSSGLDKANIVFANEYSEPIADHFSAQKRCWPKVQKNGRFIELLTRSGLLAKKPLPIAVNRARWDDLGVTSLCTPEAESGASHPIFGMGDDRCCCINCHLPRRKRRDHPFFGVGPNRPVRLVEGRLFPGAPDFLEAAVTSTKPATESPSIIGRHLGP